MTFSPKLQLQISGTWVDATRYDSVTKVLDDGKINVNRGRSDVQDRTPASTCTWIWQDPNGVYVNDNPRSPYYGILPRNTPVRAYVTRPTTALLIVDQNDGARASTPDRAALEIAGDIDVRIDIEPAHWTRFGSGTGKLMTLASKYGPIGNRSWWFRLREDGTINFGWTTDGTNLSSVNSTTTIPQAGRLAIRAQAVMNNGAAGNTVTFATASTINGTYTTLGTPIVRAGVSSIFAGTGNVEVGTTNAGALDFVTQSITENYVGRVYGFQLRDSTATLVAAPDFTAQAVGTTSFSDGVGNTWTTAGVAEITNADYRFYGELSAPRQRPIVSRNGVGVDVKTEGEAGGLIRRLTANATPLQSPIYRNFTTYNPNGWWPGEDESAATVVSSAVSGADPAIITDITFSGYDSTLPGSAGVMTLGGTGPIFTGICRGAAATTETHFIGYFKFPTIPLSAQTIFTIYGDGTVRRWEFVADTLQYTLKGYDQFGTQIVTKQTGFGTGTEPTNWIAYHLQLTNSAGTIGIKSEWNAIGSDIFLSQNAVGTLSYAGTNGSFTRVVVQGIAALSGVKMAHLMTTNQTGLLFFSSDLAFAKFSRGYAGETADARFIRVCTEQGIRPVTLGLLGDSELMGPQPIDEVMNVLYECQEVDGGLLSETRDQLALEYRTRTFLLNQPAGSTLSYTIGKYLAGPLESTPDDTNVTNDVTLSRRNGGSARAVLSSGPMSILAPALGGIGRVPDEPEINNYADGRLPYLAQQRLMLGTWPEARYPSVRIEMSRTPFTAGNAAYLAAVALNSGDMIIVSDLPQFMPPDSIYLMAQGLRETITNFLWDITFNTSPYGPYRVSELRATDDYRADATASTLAAGVTSTATTLSVATSSGPLLSTAAGDLPYDIKIGGERMTVTAASGTTSPQSLTVTRSVNGIIKAQTINSPLTVFSYVNASL